MMPELSLNILDLAQNSVTAKATLITITVAADTQKDTLYIAIQDNGCGMSDDKVKKVTDPFYTTRTTRKVGLGIPFFKMAAELTGGQFRIESAPGVGTTTSAVFGLGHIDRMPLGDMPGTMTALIGPNPDIDFILSYSVDSCGFTMDTREFRTVLGDVKLSEPAVLEYISGFIAENMAECGKFL